MVIKNYDDHEDDDGEKRPDPSRDPPQFTAALATFGQRARKDVAFYAELYVKMCADAGQQPAPQMLLLLQSKDKKDFLKRIQDGKAGIYLPGNDATCRRRLTDLDLDVICQFLLKCFSGRLLAIDLRFNSLEDAASPCQLIINSKPSVKELNLMFNNLTDYGISSIRQALLISKSLVSLCLSGSKLTEHGAVEVANLVGNLPSLRYLNLSYCNLTIEAVITIMITLRSNESKLEALDLNSPYILDWTGRTVLIDHCARMLISNRHLIELHLGKIGLDDFELDRLMIGLRQNNTLRYLNLQSNKLNRDGARLLMEYLMKNRTIEVLNLDSNHFTDQGIEWLSNGIFERSSLKIISLRYCTFGNLGLRYLTVGILRSSSLERINVWQGVSLTGEGCEAFQNLISTGRIQPNNLDVLFYQVDGQWSIAERGDGGLAKWDVYTPAYAEYSHAACYAGFVETRPYAFYPSKK